MLLFGRHESLERSNSPSRISTTKLDMSITLEAILEPAILRKAWRNIRKVERQVHLSQAPLVKDSTGGIALEFNLTTTLEYIRARVLDGSYRPQLPLVIEAAKSKLLRRRLSFLSIEDSLILSSLVQSTQPSLVSKMPTWVSFGRSDNKSDKNESTSISFDYEGWWTKWLRYRNLLKLIEDDPNPYLVISDIVNFYGSVDLSLLRSKVTAVTSLESPANDFLFYMLDRLLPSHNYGPKKLFGLPVVTDDTSRILAHYFLLELDSALRKEGKDNRYTRWVDDMVVSVPDHLEGVKVVARIENALSEIGLVANASKTEIISKTEFRSRHYVEENEFLDTVHQLTDDGLAVNRRQFDGRIREFLTNSHRGYGARILRRYYTQSRRCRSKLLVLHWREHLVENPSNASQILDYVAFFQGDLRFCMDLFALLRTHGALFEDLQILCYESLLLRPFPNDPIIRSYVVQQTYLHHSGFGEFDKPSDYVRALQVLVMYKFGSVSVSKLVNHKFAERAVASPLYATYAFPVIAADPNLRSIAFEVVERIDEPSVWRLKVLIEKLALGDSRATGLLIGLLDPKVTRLPMRHVINPRALPLLAIARRCGSFVKAQDLRAAVANAGRKVQKVDDPELIDWITLSHM